MKDCILFAFACWCCLAVAVVCTQSCKTPDVPVPFPTTTTTTIPPVVNDDTSWPDVVYMTGNTPVKYASLKESCKATLLGASESGYTLEYVENPVWQSHDDNCDGFICSMWKHDGKMIAYYWDGKAIRSPYTYVSLHHWSDEGSPIKDVRPNTGDPIGIFFVSDDLTQRSTICWTTWMGI